MNHFLRFYLRETRRKWSNFVYPALGFLICTLLWLSLSGRAKELGVAWIAIGLVWGAYNTRGFRRELVSLESPESDGEADTVVPEGATVSRR